MDLSLLRRRELRRLATDAESLLWRILRGRQLCGFKFRRQHPAGPYILDFYCRQHRLAIELDGGQHFTTEGKAWDVRRTEFLARQGIRVIRFTNLELFEQPDAVVEVIQREIGGPFPASPALPASPPGGGRGRRA